MNPIALFEVDLADVPRELSATSEHHSARVLAFEHGLPLGWLELELVDGKLGGHVVLAAAECSLADERCAARELASSAGDCSAAGEPGLTVAICTHERPQHLDDCLTALGQQTLPGLSVLVVDNAPRSERTREVAARHPRVRYVREDRQGLDFARNRALTECTTPLLAYVDDDTVPHRAWAQGVAGAFRVDPEAVAVTGPVVPFSLETPAELHFENHGGFNRGFWPQRFARQSFGHEFQLHLTGKCGAGCNMAFRREFLQGIGGFDASLDVGARLPGGGDLDAFSRTLRAGGLIVYEPKALLRHRHRTELAALRSQFFNWGRGYTAALTATFVDEPALRANVVRAGLWWLLGYQLRQRLLGRLLGRNRTRVSFILLEILGGVVGPWTLLSTRRYVRRCRAR